MGSCKYSILYLTEPFADQIKRHAKESQNHTYTLLLVPRISTLVSRILEEEGVLGDVRISSYNLQFIPIADDVISLENDNAFKEIWVVRPKVHALSQQTLMNPRTETRPSFTIRRKRS